MREALTRLGHDWPGHYSNLCSTCGIGFSGDKRDVVCVQCAINALAAPDAGAGLLTNAQREALEAALAKGQTGACIEAVRALTGDPHAFAVAVARWLLAADARLREAAVLPINGGRYVLISPEVRDALLALVEACEAWVRSYDLPESDDPDARDDVIDEMLERMENALAAVQGVRDGE